MDNNLCAKLIQVFFELRPAFSRLRTAQWACLVVLGFCIRKDMAGVTSFVRTFDLRPSCYQSLLDSFRSKALNLDRLNQLWLKLCLKLFSPVRANGRLVFACDGIKAPKEGRCMPAVKLCHQSSTNNSKPEYVMAHSMQMLALLVEGFGNKISAILIGARIHEGLKWSNRDHRTLLDKMNKMFFDVVEETGEKMLLVADAYYASAALLESMASQGATMLVRVRNNAVGYLPPKVPEKPKRGRPQKYGDRVVVFDLFQSRFDDFIETPSPIRDETDISIRYLAVDLLWKQHQDKVRFILSDHPTRGQFILMTSDWELDPVEAIRIYHARFGIEMSFKALIHTVGGFGYHFWMKGMEKLKRDTGTQYMHRKTEGYRKHVHAKIDTYHACVNLAVIAQGLLCYFAIHHSKVVWGSFGMWMRTIRKDVAPSEAVTAEAMRQSFFEYLESNDDPLSFKKFLATKVEPARMIGHLLKAG